MFFKKKNIDFSNTFTTFEESFTPDENTITGNVWQEPVLMQCLGYENFAKKYAGASFNNGMFRFYDATSAPVMQELAEAIYFGGNTVKTKVFGSDWLGRQYAVNPANAINGVPRVSMFEIEHGQCYIVDTSFIDFF